MGIRTDTHSPVHKRNQQESLYMRSACIPTDVHIGIYTSLYMSPVDIYTFIQHMHAHKSQNTRKKSYLQTHVYLYTHRFASRERT